MFIFFQKIVEKLGLKRHPPLNSLSALANYVEKQAAFVSQVSLYEYIKTRAGTQYPKLFTNETYLTSMKIARWHIFGAAVCDLSLFAAAQLVVGGGASKKQAEKIAATMIADILSRHEQEDVDKKVLKDLIKRGKDRAHYVDWQEISTGGGAFQSSADALMRWTPIADELKEQDDEIVRNSIHLKWINVRRELKELIRVDEILSDMERK